MSINNEAQPIIDHSQVGMAYELARAAAFQKGLEDQMIFVSYKIKPDAIINTSRDSIEASKDFVTKGEGAERYMQFLKHLAGLKHCTVITPLELRSEIDVDEDSPLL